VNSESSPPELRATAKPKDRKETQTRRIPPYHVVLENDDYHSFEFVVEVLGKALSSDPDFLVRSTCIQEIERLKEARFLPMLEKAAQNETHEQVRERARKAAEALKGAAK